MKIYATLGLAAMIAGFGAAGAHAQSSIYVYNFNDGGASGASATAANTVNLFTVDRNNTSHPTTGSILSSNFTASNIVNFGGTTVNADAPDVATTGTANQALALQTGTSLANNGKYLQATADLTGYQGITFSFATQQSSTQAFSNNQFQYSLDGTNFTNFGAAYTPAASFTAAGSTPIMFDLSSIAGLNNDSTAAFRIVFDGATGSSTTNNRIDNLIISGSPFMQTTAPVPEASTTVSLGLMLALGGLAFAVKKKKASVAL